jgi:glycine hydroxymethyltransferase
MEQIANWIDRIIVDVENEKVTATVKGEVNEYMKQFPLYE